MWSSDTELHYLYRLSTPRAEGIAPGRHELAHQRYIARQAHRRRLELQSARAMRLAGAFRWLAGQAARLQRLATAPQKSQPPGAATVLVSSCIADIPVSGSAKPR